MALYYSDSDDERVAAIPPRDFRSLDRQVCAHFIADEVVDGVTGEPIDGNTVITSLYTDRSGSFCDNLLRNVTCTANPKLRCQLETGDGKLIPSDPGESRADNCYLQVTFNKLLIAPVIRLEAHFPNIKVKNRPHLILALEFHFNQYIEGGDNMIKNYNHTGNTISFNAGRATSSGSNLVPGVLPRLTSAQRELLQALGPFLGSGQRHNIRLHILNKYMSSDEVQALKPIRDRLPGGAGKLLPSIGVVEYLAFGDKLDRIWCKPNGMRKPRTLIGEKVPLPMVPLECGPTFSTLKEAQVQLAYSAVNADAEAREALKLWAVPRHNATLFLFEKFAILGLKFATFDKLGDGSRDVPFNLPLDIECKFTMKLPGKVIETFVDGVLMNGHPGRGIEPYDAFFQITSHSSNLIKKGHRVGERYEAGFVKCKPHYSSFTFNSQLETVGQLSTDTNKRWVRILLNQRHDTIPNIDMTTGIDQAILQKVESWLHAAMGWNDEQKKALKGIHSAKGGLMLVMGPAATGKTLLQRFLILYFYFLGYHVLAVAPANDNVNKLARDLHEFLEWVEKEGKKHLLFRFLRLFPGSRDIAPEEMNEDQAKNRKVGHDGGNVLSFNEFLIALDEHKKEKLAHRIHGVAETIIKLADDKEEVLKSQRSDGTGKRILDEGENAYDVLREFMGKYRKREVDWKDTDAITKYKTAYNVCKANLIKKNRIMITTTGNVRSKEMLSYWFEPHADGGVLRKGVIVIADEGPKDFEVNLWSPIVCEKWASMVKGVLIFGDDKQLQPPNTSSKGKVMFNYYSDRLDIPLPTRLVSEGFPCHYLSEQRRMHPVLSDFPNRKVYFGKLKDAPGRRITINEEMPGLREVLVEIISGTISDAEQRDDFREEVTDDDLRRHYVQVKGRRTMNEVTMSKAVVEHVDVFFQKIFPKLQAYFKKVGKSMEREVLVICAYGYALGMYKERFQAMRQRDPTLTAADLPRVMTIDSSQGDESYMVFFDASIQHGNMMGFMDSRHRFNVAITRAKGVLWEIGGSMEMAPWSMRPIPQCLAVDYKDELDEAAMQLHKFQL